MSNEQIQGAATVSYDNPSTEKAVLGWKAHGASFEVLSLLGEQTLDFFLFPVPFLSHQERFWPLQGDLPPQSWIQVSLRAQWILQGRKRKWNLRSLTWCQLRARPLDKNGIAGLVCFAIHDLFIICSLFFVYSLCQGEEWVLNWLMQGSLLTLKGKNEKNRNTNCFNKGPQAQG